MAGVKPVVLVVDDDAALCDMLSRFLQQLGYDAATAGDGREALAVLGARRIQCMLLDVGLPGSSGVELVPQIMATDPDVALLMLSGAGDATTAALCIQRGALDYLSKPVDLDLLERAIARALARRSERMADRHSSRADIERISVATLEALVNALEAKDPHLRGHSARVADLAATVAAATGANDDQIERVRTAGRLHDIGKIGIREDLLSRPGPLTDEEYEEVKQHVVVGSQILRPLVHLHDVIAFVRSHHERWDGSGYPDRLSGEAIPLGARIINAAEIYDALTTSRPYQERMEPAAAIERMRELVGTVLDPDVHAALARVVAGRHALPFLDDSG